MKMAKATERDMEAALSVCRAIECLHDGHLPDDCSEIEDIVWYEDHKHAARVVDHLIDVSKGASLFRVCFGMTVLLDPANELVDPNLSYLEHHPKVDRMHAMLLWVLYHHQGGSSHIGQPIRKLLGIEPHAHLNEEQISAAKAIAEELMR